MSASGVSPGGCCGPFALLFTAGLRARGGALPLRHAVELRRDRDADDADPRRFHRQFRAARRVQRTRAGLHLPLSRARRPTARCAACSCRIAAIPPRSPPILPRSAKPSTRTAQTYLVLSKGSYQRPERSAAIRRSSPSTTTRSTCRNSSPRATTSSGRASAATAELLASGPKDRDAQRLAGALRGELYRPFEQPALCLRRRADRLCRARRSAHDPAGPRRRRPASPCSIFAALRMAGIAATSLAVSEPRAAILVWALPLGASLACARRDLRRPAALALMRAPRAPARAATSRA